MKISPKDLYVLRRAQLLAERKALVAQLAQHSLKRLSLELERRYDLLGRNTQLDITTGLVSLSDEDPKGGNGR